MALNINTNIGALGAAASASSVNKAMETSMERLSSGLRVNTAADDAAGVAIASRLTSEIRGTNMAIRNAMDGQAMIDTAEGAHNEITNILQRMRELAVQAANDTNDANDRSNLQAEIDQLATEINRIADATTWAGQKLLNGTGGTGSNGAFTFQVGTRTNSEDQITATINSMTAGSLGIDAPSPASDIVVSTGGTMSAAGALTMNTNLTANLEFGGTDFTLDFDVAELNGATISGSAMSVTATAGAASFEINGITVEIAALANRTGADATTALIAAFDTARTANMSALGHLTATVDGTTATQINFTATAANKANTMESLLKANTSFNNAYTVANSAGVLTFTARSAVPSVSQAAGTFTGYGGATAATSTQTNNTITIATVDGTAQTSSRYSTNVYNVNGTEVTFNTYDDGVAKGFDNTVEGMASALKAKLEDAGLGLTVTQDAGELTLSTAGSISVGTASGARTAIEKIDAAINTVNTQRANLGAISNRLDNTVANLTNISTNLEAGRSRIQDADFAAESTNLAKAQILQQASMAMLAQANASKQGVLQLLQG